MTPDRRRRTLAGRMRRAEPAVPAADASPEQDDPFAEIRQAAQAEAVRELGQALTEGDVREEDLHEKVTKAIDEALAEAGTPSARPTAYGSSARSRTTSSATGRSSRSWPTRTSPR